jgi:hypothetical protein
MLGMSRSCTGCPVLQTVLAFDSAHPGSSVCPGPLIACRQSTGEVLRKHFENNAVAALGKVVVLLQDSSLYAHALKKLEQGVDLSADLPKIKDVKPAIAKKVMKRLVADAEKATFTFWELSSNVGKIFRTTIRLQCDEQSLVTCFDVNCKSYTAKGAVVIAVKTWRRNVNVTVDGRVAALDLLHGQFVIAGMR